MRESTDRSHGASPPGNSKNGAEQPASDGKDRLINPRTAYDWSRISNELDDMGLTPPAFRVYCNLLRRSDKHSHTCYPGTRRIAHDCKMNRETTIEALRELEGQGMLKVERAWGKRSDYEILPISKWKLVPKTDQSEMRTGRKKELASGRKEEPAGNRDTNPIHSSLNPIQKETTKTKTARACAHEQAEAAPPAPDAPSSSFSFEGNRSENTTEHQPLRAAEEAIKKEKAADNPLPAAAVTDDGEDHTEELDELAEEFGITEAQKQQLAVYAKREGIDYVREKADVTCSEPRDNLARTFMAALKGDWTLPRSSAPKPEKRPIEQEIYGWRDTLLRLYPEADVDAQYPSWGVLARDLTMLEELKAAHAAEKAAQDAVAEARSDRLKQMWLEASEDQRKRWIAASAYHKKSAVPTDGTLPSPLVMAFFASVMLPVEPAQATGKLEAAA